MSYAKIYLIKIRQRNAYPEVYKCLSGYVRLVPSIIKQLALFIDDYGILRCRGRLHNSELVDRYGDPVLVHPVSLTTKLLVLDMHSCRLHSGAECVLAELRGKHWIPKGRQTVKKNFYVSVSKVIRYMVGHTTSHPTRIISRTSHPGTPFLNDWARLFWCAQRTIAE